MDIYKVNVDPAIYRSVLLHKRLKRFPNVLNRPPISRNTTSLIRKTEGKSHATFRRAVRSRPLRKEVPPALEKELVTSSYPEYCWEISQARRKRNKALREELGEKNPYSYPVEGVRHNLRNLIEPVTKAIVKKKLTLPVHKKYSQKLERQLKAQAIVSRIYSETEPTPEYEDKPEPVPANLETSTPLEYRLTWKSIEMCRIMSKIKKDEINHITENMREAEAEALRKSNSLRSDAEKMERTIAESEKILYEMLRRLVAEKENTRQKMQRIEDIVDQIALRRHQIQFIMSRLEEMQKYGLFLYNLSPRDWRDEHKEMKDIEMYQDDVMDDLQAFGHFVRTKVPKPAIYFETPEEFTALITELENVNFVVYSHSKIITSLAEAGTNYAVQLTKRCNLELDILRELAQELEREIAWEESHMKLLKDFCSKYIFTDFAALVYEVENVKQAVESIYVDVLTTNDLNLDAATLMKEIELLVVNLTESANPSHPDTIRLTKQMNQESRLRELAQRKFEKTFREYELLLKELRRSFDYEKKPPRRRLMTRSPPNPRGGEQDMLTARERTVRDENFKFFGDDAFPCRSLK